MARPEIVVITKPGLAGTRGPAGSDGVSAVNNVINPVVVNDAVFGSKTEIADLSYTMSPSITLTFEATLIIKGLTGSTAIVYVEGPQNSLVSAIMTLPYSVAPQAINQSVSFAVPTATDKDHQIVKIAGSVKNGNSTGKVAVYVENLDGSLGGYVAQSSFAQWSVPVFAVIGQAPGSGSGTGDLTKAQADTLYVARTDSRLSDSRPPTDRSVNANKIAAGGLPISSIDQLRNELDTRVRTINGTSPDINGNIDVSGSGQVSGITQNTADSRYVQLTDARLTDQRVPLDNSVINQKVPNAALDLSKINGLAATLDQVLAQLSNVTQRLSTLEQNGATPGGGNPGTGYPAVYTATY